MKSVLVNGVYPASELLQQAENLVRKILANGPVAIKLTMEAAIHGSQMSLEEGLNLEANLFGMSCTTEDMKEGTRAFVEKRAANFKGK